MNNIYGAIHTSSLMLRTFPIAILKPIIPANSIHVCAAMIIGLSLSLLRTGSVTSISYNRKSTSCMFKARERGREGEREKEGEGERGRGREGEREKEIGRASCRERV